MLKISIIDYLIYKFIYLNFLYEFNFQVVNTKIREKKSQLHSCIDKIKAESFNQNNFIQFAHIKWPFKSCTVMKKKMYNQVNKLTQLHYLIYILYMKMSPFYYHIEKLFFFLNIKPEKK